MRRENQTTVHPWSIHLKTPKICFEFALISDIWESVKIAVIPTTLSSALPPFQRILPRRNLLMISINVNSVTQTTTSSSIGSSPIRFKLPHVDQLNIVQIHATRKSCANRANFESFRKRTRSWDRTNSRVMNRATVSVIIPLKASPVQPISPVLQASSKATNAQQRAITDAPFTAACIV